jgi:hypothetical protein
MVATKRMMAVDVVGYLILRRLPGYPGADHSLVAPLSTATATNVTGCPLSSPVPIAVIVWVASLKTRERVWVEAKFTPAPGSARLTSGPPDLRAAER